MLLLTLLCIINVTYLATQEHSGKYKNYHPYFSITQAIPQIGYITSVLLDYNFNYFSELRSIVINYIIQFILVTKKPIISNNFISQMTDLIFMIFLIPFKTQKNILYIQIVHIVLLKNIEHLLQTTLNIQLLLIKKRIRYTYYKLSNTH